MKIAVPSNAGINIYNGMLGRAKYFYIYTAIKGNQFELVEKRANPYETTMQHLKTLDVYTIINDCEVIIAAFIGKKGIRRLQEKGIKLFFKKGNIQDVLNTIFNDE